LIGMELRKIERKKEELYDDSQAFKEECARYDRLIEQFNRRFAAFHSEIVDFARDVHMKAKASIEEMVQKYNDPAQRKLSMEKMEGLRWLEDLRHQLKQHVAPKLGEMEEKLEEMHHSESWYAELKTCNQELQSIMADLGLLKFDIRLEQAVIKTPKLNKRTKSNIVKFKKRSRVPWGKIIVSMGIILGIVLNKEWVVSKTSEYYQRAHTIFTANATALQEKKQPQPAVQAPRVLITVSDANIRKDPSLQGETVGTVDEGSELIFLNRVEEDSAGRSWYYVNYQDGLSGWISSKITKWK
jgi:hypothetical protein